MHRTLDGEHRVDIYRKMHIIETRFRRWRNKYHGPGVSELRELKQIREDNRKRKGFVADLTFDSQVLGGPHKKASEASADTGVGYGRSSRSTACAVVSRQRHLTSQERALTIR